MSNLLEQAIIDAAALKEVAMKNAETALIEKYSKEFKESVEKLLEQEEPAAPASPIAADPMALGGGVQDTEKEKAFEKVESSFLDGDDEELITIDFDQIKKQLTNALGGGSPLLSTPEMSPAPETEAPVTPEASPAAAETPMLENIEISEEELEETYENPGHEDLASDALTGEPKREDKLISKKNKEKNGDTMPPETLEEFSLEEFELEESAVDDKLAANEKKKLQLGQEEAALEDEKAKEQKRKEEEARRAAAAAGVTTTTQVRPMEENIEISVEELQELAEELKVDINIENLSDGHMGTTVTQKREQRNLEFAAARNQKEEERREEEEKAMSDLKNKLDEAIELGTLLADENEDLKEKMSEMYSHLETLKENVEKLSISNAKLLYTNKALGNTSLNERQKEQIVENISKSTSVLEAKTIYNTLQGAVSGVSSPNKPKESLSEALIRGNSPFLTRKQQTAELSFADRMKKLAGITKE